MADTTAAPSVPPPIAVTVHPVSLLSDRRICRSHRWHWNRPPKTMAVPSLAATRRPLPLPAVTLLPSPIAPCCREAIRQPPRHLLLSTSLRRPPSPPSSAPNQPTIATNRLSSPWSPVASTPLPCRCSPPSAARQPPNQVADVAASPSSSSALVTVILLPPPPLSQCPRPPSPPRRSIHRLLPSHRHWLITSPMASHLPAVVPLHLPIFPIQPSGLLSVLLLPTAIHLFHEPSLAGAMPTAITDHHPSSQPTAPHLKHCLLSLLQPRASLDPNHLIMIEWATSNPRLNGQDPI